MPLNSIEAGEDLIRQRAKKIVLKSQRRELNTFFIVSSIYYLFMLIMCFCLVPIAVSLTLVDEFFESKDEKEKLFSVIVFMVFFTMISSFSLIYLTRRVHWLLIEKDEELRFRSLRVGSEDVIKEHRDDDNNTTDHKKHASPTFGGQQANLNS